MIGLAEFGTKRIVKRCIFPAIGHTNSSTLRDIGERVFKEDNVDYDDISVSINKVENEDPEYMDSSQLYKVVCTAYKNQ